MLAHLSINDAWSNVWEVKYVKSNPTKHTENVDCVTRSGSWLGGGVLSPSENEVGSMLKANAIDIGNLPLSQESIYEQNPRAVATQVDLMFPVKRPVLCDAITTDVVFIVDTLTPNDGNSS